MITEKQVINPPAVELDLQTVKNFMRVDYTDDDALISGMIQTAREKCEAYCMRAFITQTIQIYYDKIERQFTLPYSPIQTVSQVQLIYLNEISNLTLNADYYVLGNQDKWLTITATTYNLPPGFSPGDDLSRYHLSVTYSCGYDTQYSYNNGAYTAGSSKVPLSIQTAIMKTVAADYELRGNVQPTSRQGVIGFIEIPNDAKSLLNPYRVISL